MAGVALLLEAGAIVDASFDGKSLDIDMSIDPLSVSAEGEDYAGLGCFQTGLPASREAFNALLEGQKKLRDLKMLDRVGGNELSAIGEKLRPLREISLRYEQTAGMVDAIDELLTFLALSTGEDIEIIGRRPSVIDRIRIFLGIHSGFHRNNGEQFWGLYDTQSETGCTDMFISLSFSLNPNYFISNLLFCN